MRSFCSNQNSIFHASFHAPVSIGVPSISFSLPLSLPPLMKVPVALFLSCFTLIARAQNDVPDLQLGFLQDLPDIIGLVDHPPPPPSLRRSWFLSLSLFSLTGLLTPGGAGEFILEKRGGTITARAAVVACTSTSDCSISLPANAHQKCIKSVCSFGEWLGARGRDFFFWC